MKICEWCQVGAVKKANRRFCSRSCSSRWKLSRPEHKKRLSEGRRHSDAYQKASERMKIANPMRDPKTVTKMARSRAARGFAHLLANRGGNGKPLPIPQLLLATLLGWETEVVIPTGRRSPYPRHYKLDIADRGLKINVEADGESHSGKRKAQDARRDGLLTELGWTVLRFKNREIMGQPELVLQVIRQSITWKQVPPIT